MRHLCIVAFLAFQMLPSAAHALSCAPPVMDEKAIEYAAAIFEGTVTAIEETTEMPRAKPMGGKAGIFTFTVTKAWKGVEAGASVDVLRNTYWGDGFEKDVPYLVFAVKNGDRFEANLCGLSQRLEQAGTSLEYLKKHFEKKPE